MKTIRWAGLVALALVLSVGGMALTRAQGDGPGEVVFASDRTGNFEIYVLNPETGLTVQTTNNAGSDIEPVWSPDGEYIAFASDRDGDYEIYLMQKDGSDVRQLTNNTQEDRQPRWQPNGDYLVYVSNVNGQFDIYSLSVEGAMVRQLTNDTFDERGPTAAGAGPVVGTTVPTIAAASPTPSLPDGVVDSYSLNVRNNPGEGAQILTTVRNNDPLDIVGRRYDNTWLQVITANGTRGWVFAQLVEVNIDLNTIPVVDAPFVSPPPTATPTPEPTATSGAVVVSFTANVTTISSGGCATLTWNVAGIREVYFQGQGVVGSGSSEVCPTTTTTYQLRVILMSGVVDDRYVTITVNP